MAQDVQVFVSFSSMHELSVSSDFLDLSSSPSSSFSHSSSISSSSCYPSTSPRLSRKIPCATSPRRWGSTDESLLQHRSRRDAASIGTLSSGGGSRNALRKSTFCDSWLFSCSLRSRWRHSVNSVGVGRVVVQVRHQHRVLELSSLLADGAERLHTLSGCAGAHDGHPGPQGVVCEAKERGEATHLVGSSCHVPRAVGPHLLTVPQ